MTAEPRHLRAARTAVVALSVLYAVYFSVYTILHHERFRSYAFDLGTFDQGIWLAGHSDDWFVTVRGLPLLGDHVRVISLFLAPLYWFWNDVNALLTAQSIAIAAGAGFLFRIATRELPGHPWVAAAFSTSYLLHPAVQNLNLDHAHPDAFAQTFFLACIDFLRRGRMLGFSVFMVLAMACKEDIPLVFGGLGLALMTDPKQRRLGFTIAAVAGLYFLACMFVILPYYNGVGFFRFSTGGFLYSLGGHSHDPIWILQRIFRYESLVYLYQVGVVPLFLFLLSPAWLIPTIPPLLANLLADAVYMRSLDWHYQTSIVPFFYFASILTLARMERGEGLVKLRGNLVWGAVAAALVLTAMEANQAWSKVKLDGASVIFRHWNDLLLDDNAVQIRKVLEKIPPKAVVSADYTLVPHLSHRKYIYMYPNPFRVNNWGVLGENMHDPDTVEYVVIRKLAGHDFAPDLIEHLQASLRFEKIVDVPDVVALYKRLELEKLNDRSSCADWDGDGKTGERDVRLIGEAIMKKLECPMHVCDIDGDGVLRSADVLRLGKRMNDPAAPLNCPAK